MFIPVSVRVPGTEVSEKLRSMSEPFLQAHPYASIPRKAEGDCLEFLLGLFCQKVKGEADFATIFQVSNLLRSSVSLSLSFFHK